MQEDKDFTEELLSNPTLLGETNKADEDRKTLTEHNDNIERLVVESIRVSTINAISYLLEKST